MSDRRVQTNFRQTSGSSGKEIDLRSTKVSAIMRHLSFAWVNCLSARLDQIHRAEIAKRAGFQSPPSLRCSQHELVRRAIDPKHLFLHLICILIVPHFFTPLFLLPEFFTCFLVFHPCRSTGEQACTSHGWTHVSNPRQPFNAPQTVSIN